MMRNIILGLFCTFVFMGTCYAVTPMQFGIISTSRIISALFSNEDGTAQNVEALRIEKNIDGGYGWIGDIGVHVNDTGEDLLCFLNTFGIDQTAGGNFSSTNATMVTSFNDIDAGEFGTDSDVDATELAFNDFCWDTGTSKVGMTDVIGSGTGYNISGHRGETGLPLNTYIRFESANQIDEVRIYNEHNEFCDQDWCLDNVKFYNGSGDRLYPTTAPISSGDFAWDSNGNEGSLASQPELVYRWKFYETEAPSPVVDGLEIRMSGHNDDIRVADLAVIRNTDKRDIDAIRYMSAVPLAENISGFADLSPGEYGATSSATTDNINDWATSGWELASGENMNVGSIFFDSAEVNGKSIFLYFSSAQSLGTVAINFDNTDVDGDPRSSITFHDLHGNEINTTRQSANGVYMYVMNNLGTFNNPAGSTEPIFWEFANVEYDTSAAPYRITSPDITGTNQVGETLTVSGYDFDGETSTVIDWFGDDVSLSSASTNYVIPAADAGKIIFASVTALNANGDTSLVSNTMTVIAYNSVAPTISGTEQVGQTLTCNNGTWAGADSYTYRWINNTDGTISGATSQTYTIASSDDGDTLYCEVAGVNGGGTSGYIASGNTAAILSGASYSCIEILFEPNTTWVGVQDVGILVDGDTGTDLVTSMTSVSAASAVAVTGCGDLSTNEYGTTSTYNSEDNDWNNAFWTDWTSGSEPHTVSTHWNGSGADMRLFFKFPTSSQLTQVHFRLKNIPTYSEPTITFKDSTGTTITPSSSTNDGNTDRNYKFEF